MAGVKLDFISDTNMYQFIEKAMRGGISYIAKRYSKANNNYIKFYNNSYISKYKTFLHVNNFYGCAMSQYIPYSGFKW